MDAGLKQAFIVTGGAAMHLNDSISREKKIRSTFMHHEQALAIAAEGYARVTRTAAIVNVTSGPGGINALNGVFGAFVDSIPMFVISGQARTETVARLNHKNLRQLGDQEADIFSIASSMVKYIAVPKNKYEAINAINKAICFLETGRPGPVWVDMPVNLQGITLSKKEITTGEMEFSSDTMLEYIHPNVKSNLPNLKKLDKNVKEVIDSIRKAKRPVFFIGNGVYFSEQQELLLKILSKMGIPAVTGWNAHDLLPNDHVSYCGKPGTVGDRAGNFTVRSADLLLVLGCRLNIRQISYNWTSFAPDAKILMVDIDKYELSKHTLKVSRKLHYDLRDFLPALDGNIVDWEPIKSHIKYLQWCRDRVNKYPVVTNKVYDIKKRLNPYAFFNELYACSTSEDIVVLGNGSACVMGFQSAFVKKGLRLFSNSGCASMGYDLPAAIGASLSDHLKKKRVICVAGDGSIMMNIQELSTVSFLALPLKIFILDNSGYHSIRQSQMSNFPDNVAGTRDTDGLGFPDFIRVAGAFDLKSTVVTSTIELKEVLCSDDFLNSYPHVFVLKLDTDQNFEPKLQSRKLLDGSMATPELHDLAPFLDREELKSNIIED